MARACRVQQVETRGVSVIDAKVEALEQLDRIWIVVQHRCFDAAREQNTPDDLSEAPEARDDDRRALVDDLVGFSVRRLPPHHQLVVQDHQ